MRLDQFLARHPPGVDVTLPGRPTNPGARRRRGLRKRVADVRHHRARPPESPREDSAHVHGLAEASARARLDEHWKRADLLPRTSDAVAVTRTSASRSRAGAATASWHGVVRRLFQVCDTSKMWPPLAEPFTRRMGFECFSWSRDLKFEARRSRGRRTRRAARARARRAPRATGGPPSRPR